MAAMEESFLDVQLSRPVVQKDCQTSKWTLDIVQKRKKSSNSAVRTNNNPWILKHHVDAGGIITLV